MQALTDIARDVNVWKAFAMEASHSNGYSDFGRMLLKIHNVIPLSDDSLWGMDRVSFLSYIFFIIIHVNCYDLCLNYHTVKLNVVPIEHVFS